MHKYSSHNFHACTQRIQSACTSRCINRLHAWNCHGSYTLCTVCTYCKAVITLYIRRFGKCASKEVHLSVSSVGEQTASSYYRAIGMLMHVSTHTGERQLVTIVGILLSSLDICIVTKDIYINHVNSFHTNVVDSMISEIPWSPAMRTHAHSCIVYPCHLCCEALLKQKPPQAENGLSSPCVPST